MTAPGATIRVASAPATHLYAWRFAQPRVERLTDPTDDDLARQRVSIVYAFHDLRHPNHTASEVQGATIAPSCGAYADQGADHLFDSAQVGIDPSRLCDTIAAAVVAGPPRPIPVVQRVRQRQEAADAHVRIDRGALTRVRGERAA